MDGGVERISIEVTNRCGKGCWFCYNHSGPGGATTWTPAALVGFVTDCAAHGVRAVSFGGGEPLDYSPLLDVLRALDGLLFRSLTTHGLRLDERFDELVLARPDKVHVSIHFPHNEAEVSRVIDAVHRLAGAGIASGINLLVRRCHVEAARRAAARVRAAGIGNEHIVYLPMRGRDTPSPAEMAAVAGDQPFQSMSCLTACGPSPRFCSIGWDRRVAWCSYTASRANLASLDYRGLVRALDGLGLAFCGGTDDDPLVRLSSRPQHGHAVVRD